MKTIPLFVIGSGRSGTHLLGYLLGSHPDIRITIEEKGIFGKVTHSAVNRTRRLNLIPKIIRSYNRQIKRTDTRYYCDKSHPNIWNVDWLQSIYTNALFIGIYRNPYQTVSSMLKHKGVMRWTINWRKYPFPNKFLGTSVYSENEYELLDYTQRSTLRWISHYKELMRLKNIYGDKVMVIEYNQLLENTSSVMSEVSEFLGLGNFFKTSGVSTKPLDKWKSHLSSEQIEKVQKMILENGISEFLY